VTGGPVAARWDAEYREGRYVAEPPLPFVGDIVSTLQAHPEALATPRQRARFLCGLTSPATTRAKLSRHALFGALADQRFADVLDRA